jgi:hypothetical protein
MGDDTKKQNGACPALKAGSNAAKPDFKNQGRLLMTSSIRPYSLASAALKK